MRHVEDCGCPDCQFKEGCFAGIVLLVMILVGSINW